MVKQITLTVSDEEWFKSLADCRVGDEKTITFTVGDMQSGKLSGDVTSVEGYEDDDEESYDAEEETPREDSHGKMRKRMPKAIIMIGDGK